MASEHLSGHVVLGVLRLVVTLWLQGPGQAPVDSPVSVRKR